MPKMTNHFRLVMYQDASICFFARIGESFAGFPHSPPSVAELSPAAFPMVQCLMMTSGILLSNLYNI